MKTLPPEFVFSCPADEIAAYIDGDLPPELDQALEDHLSECSVCRRELNHQKEFLLAIAGSLEKEAPIALPENFTRRIVVNAESSVSGLRDRRERAVALIAAGVLLFLAVVTVGSVAGVFSPFRAVVEKIWALLWMIIQVAADLIYAIGGTLRSLFQTQTFATALAYITLFVGIGLILYFGARSLRRYIGSSGT